ncbi:ribonucleotide-diphosphate reductase subunit beta [Radiobacillus deserti]|uniref:ribonucleoside-diphosphate reductase n=1 Tax=Radiobacillus deserti TaxID=2594883 RepID=A0A516KCT7_9BACI|nr:ribonucleotide-diphosphate reductase subunit beta [Radiobacillus deserti]QDP39214.1 ribonucleotide-diphosphate reductase subunit beta [Radiobacillus deserti]
MNANAIKPFRVFNGNVNNRASRIFGGEASGICDWDDLKYPALLQLNKEMFSEYWIEDEIRLGDDLKDYRQKLTAKERYVFNVITGYLTQLDSIANRFNFLLGYITTDPSVASCIQLIASFEGLHNRSYQYLTSTMLNDSEKRQAFNAPKELATLKKRNQIIIDKIQETVDYMENVLAGKEEENTEKFYQVLYEGLLAYIILEGLYFSGGFVYFHSLARDNKMIGSNNMINLIKKDETQHNVFYGMVMQILMLENPSLNTDENYEYAVSFVKKCVEAEKEWAAELFSEIDTLSIKEYNDYVEYLANVICRNAGLSDIYTENKEVKSKWIINYGEKNGENRATKADFFETNVINYSHEGGDGFDL